MSTNRASIETINFDMNDPESWLHQISELNKYFDDLEAGPSLRKNTSSAEKFRTAGNKLYNRDNDQRTNLCKHDRADHMDLISMYAASICFAPKDSEDLAKGFSNRSAVLMHLSRYKEAVIDIDRALLISKSDDFKAKLESRKERCLKFLVDTSNPEISNKLPDMQSSTKLPNASEAIDVAYSDSLGRHLLATRDIKAGEVIIAEESYVCFPKYNRIHYICTHCMTFVWNGIPCDNCVFVVFCSEECKSQANQEYHDIECSIIRTMFLNIDVGHITKAMITLRSFIKAVKTEGFMQIIDEVRISNKQKDGVKKLLSNGVLDSKKWRSYYNLLFHTQKKENEYDNLESVLLIVTLLLRHTSIISVSKLEDFDSADTELLMTSIKVIMKLRRLLDYNTFMHQAPFCDCIDMDTCKQLCDSDRGTLLAATCSLINHSCCPNVSRIFLPGKKIVMFTTNPVKKGQQLCDNYGPNFTLEKEKRQLYLKEQYNFLCRCQACEEDWPPNIEMELCKSPIAASPRYKMFMKDFNKNFPGQNLPRKGTLIGFIKQWYPDKSMLEKVVTLSGLIYKHFDYKTAYYHCLLFNMYIDMTFLKHYEDKCVIPHNC